MVPSKPIRKRSKNCLGALISKSLLSICSWKNSWLSATKMSHCDGEKQCSVNQLRKERMTLNSSSMPVTPFSLDRSPLTRATFGVDLNITAAIAEILLELLAEGRRSRYGSFNCR